MNAPSSAKPQGETLDSLEIPGGWSERRQTIGRRVFDLLVPADPNEFLNQLDECSDPHVADPNWSAIWSAAPALAERVVGHEWPAETRALELGCGVGLAGLAALDAGVNVTFSDYIAAAVTLAVENARRNGFSAATGLHLDWCAPPRIEPFPLVLASDILYEKKLHADLIATLDRVLASDGQCWIGDPMRAAASDFAALARQRGYNVTVDCDDAAGGSSTRRTGFQLLILSRRAGVTPIAR